MAITKVISLFSRALTVTQNRLYHAGRITVDDLMKVNEEERLRGPKTRNLEPGRTTLYNTSQKILICGDGNFSFTHSLAVRLEDATNILATSLNTHAQLKKMFRDAEYHMVSAIKHGAEIRAEVDATKLLKYDFINKANYDCIVFNRPHCDVQSQDFRPDVIRKNQQLVNDFIYQASKLIEPQHGQIHISVKRNWPYCLWGVEDIARKHGLYTFNVIRFPLWDYPYYVNKRGAGPKADHTFCNKCTYTYIFCKKD